MEGLGLEEIGVKAERSHYSGPFAVFDWREGIYAVGDIIGAPWLAQKFLPALQIINNEASKIQTIY